MLGYAWDSHDKAASRIPWLFVPYDDGGNPTSSRECCGHAFGKDHVSLMAPAVFTYSGRTHHITPVRSRVCATARETGKGGVSVREET